MIIFFLNRTFYINLQRFQKEKKAQQSRGAEEEKEKINGSSKNSSKTILKLQRKVLQQVSYFIHIFNIQNAGLSPNI